MKKGFVIQEDIRISASRLRLNYKGTVVNGYFDCSHTHIKSLKGSPDEVTGYFSCFGTLITSLEGAPRRVHRSFNCYDCYSLTSLHNIHKQIKYIGESLHLPTSVKSNVLGVMYIEGLPNLNFYDSGSRVDRKQAIAEKIINKHLAGDRNIHDCQEELLEAGLTEYARL